MPAGAHRPGLWVGQVVVASLRVDVPRRFRDEELHRLSLELVTAVAEQPLRLGVDQGDAAVAVDRHDGVRSRVEEATEPLLDDGAAGQDRVALLEEGERLVEVGALLVELPLEPGEVDAPLDLEAAEPARVGHGDEHLARCERLDDVAVRAALQGQLGERRVVDAGHHHDREVTVFGQHRLDQPEAGFTWHHHVDQGDRERPLRQILTSLVGVGGNRALVPLAAEQAGQDRGQLVVVVDDQRAAVSPKIGGISPGRNRRS
jgi:hypothetical protein